MLLHNVKEKKDIKKYCGKFENFEKKLIFGPYRASALFMLDIQKFRVHNFNTFSINPKKFERSILNHLGGVDRTK